MVFFLTRILPWVTVATTIVIYIVDRHQKKNRSIEK